MYRVIQGKMRNLAVKYITRNDQISELPLSKRLYNCLRRSRIQTIGEMVDYPKEHNWMTVPNMGAKSIDEVNQWIEVIVTGETGYLLVDNDFMKPAEEKTENTQTDILQTAVVNMPFSIRAKNCLLSAGITTISQLVGITEEKLLGLNGMGRVSAQEILHTLKQFFDQESKKLIAKQDSSSSVDSSRNTQLVDELCGTLGGDPGSFLREIMTVEANYPEVQGETYYYRLYESKFVREKVKQKVLLLLDASKEGISRKSLAAQFPNHLNNTTILEEILIELENAHAVAAGEVIVTREYPNVFQALSVIKKDNHRDIFAKRLQGKTLEEIGSEYGITRERVRQILNKETRGIITAYPRFNEDKYAYVFSKYHFLREDFLLAFDEKISTYCYLDMKHYGSKGNRLPIGLLK